MSQYSFVDVANPLLGYTICVCEADAQEDFDRKCASEPMTARELDLLEDTLRAIQRKTDEVMDRFVFGTIDRA